MWPLLLAQPAPSDPAHLDQWEPGVIFLWIFLGQSQRRSQDPGNLRLTTSQHQHQQLGAAWSLRGGREVPWLRQHWNTFISISLETGDTHTTNSLSTDKFHQVIRICNTASSCGQPWASPVKVGSILITLLQLRLSVISIIRPGLECVP